MSNRMIVYTGLFLGGLAACQPPAPLPESTSVPERTVASAVLPEVPADLKELAQTVVQDLRNKDYPALQKRVHPQKGLLFSPYGFIDTSSAVRIPAAAIVRFLSRDTVQKQLWGFQDGSGDSLLLTAPAYLRRYVYDRDFAGKDSVLLNKMPLRGNSLNNLKDVFPDADVVEYFDAGTEEMDWRVLRLVFQTFEGRPYLVALVHDEWTI
jgi:hypothetical protein